MRHTQEPVYTTISKKNKGGCPGDTEEVEAFENTWTYFELYEEEQLTLPELLYIMQKNLKWSDISAYAKVHFKWKPLGNHGDGLITSNEDRKRDIAVRYHNS